jgi:hypothetical protein
MGGDMNMSTKENFQKFTRKIKELMEHPITVRVIKVTKALLFIRQLIHFLSLFF